MQLVTYSRTSVALILEGVQQQLNRTGDADTIAYSISLTSKEILCEIAAQRSDATFDFYDLTFYRSKACSAITQAEHDAQEASATAVRGKQTVQHFNVQFVYIYVLKLSVVFIVYFF